MTIYSEAMRPVSGNADIHAADDVCFGKRSRVKKCRVPILLVVRMGTDLLQKKEPNFLPRMPPLAGPYLSTAAGAP